MLSTDKAKTRSQVSWDAHCALRRVQRRCRRAAPLRQRNDNSAASLLKGGGRRCSSDSTARATLLTWPLLRPTTKCAAAAADATRRQIELTRAGMMNGAKRIGNLHWLSCGDHMTQAATQRISEAAYRSLCQLCRSTVVGDRNNQFSSLIAYVVGPVLRSLWSIVH